MDYQDNETTTQDSINDNYEMPDSPQHLYLSPLIESLPQGERPAISPSCETCPASIWYTTKKKLQCYCRVMHLITWDKDNHPILNCDGKLQALLEMEAQHQRG